MNFLTKIWQYKDLRNKVIIAVSLLLLTRLIAHVPLPGVDFNQLKLFFQNNQIFGLLDMFSGGTMSNFSVILMGVGPYITSSIIFQLLALVVPSIEELQKEGQSGQQKINQWTRYATVPIAILQAYAMLAVLRSQGIIPSWTMFDLIMMLISASAGTMLLMWLGELISEKGIGNGISLIISLGILSGFPTQFRNTAALLTAGDVTKILSVIGIGILLVLIVAAIIYITEGQRNISVSYARRARGATQYGAVDSHLPIRVNTAGVIPIIFAMSIMVIPGVLGKYLENAKTDWIKHAATWIVTFVNNDLYYAIIYFVLIFLFTFFYTSVVFKPDQISENLQKQGGYLPGLRPGTETKIYLGKIISRITFLGAVFLGIIGVLPYIVQSVTNISTLAIGGTGILILVAVIIDTMRQLNAQLLMHTYDHY